MKGFNSDFLDQLKIKNDIVDVIGHYVHLDRKGSNFWGRCPFHHEKTASFCVNEREQFFYCFGCHKSGDVITFIKDIESLEFSDAVKFLAERAKMPLPEITYDDDQIKEQRKKKERLLALLKDTALFYVKNLKTDMANAHKEYIIKRGFTAETVTRFGMGASLDFNGLPKFLIDKGYTQEEIVTSGVCGEKDGRLFDWLGGRLIIPVIDQFNNVVAFDGRRIDAGKDRKYINTRETPIFFKGRTLFNINNLKKLKNENGLNGIILVEGHLDVVSLTQGGFPNVVASMGTAFTKDQARMLKRYSDKVYVCYDGDFAGQNATIKSLEILEGEGLEVKVVSLPEGMDPDDVITKLGKDAYNKCLLESKPLIDFKLEALYKSFDMNSSADKRKYVSGAIKIIRESSSPAEQEDLLKTVRDYTGFTFESLRRELYSVESEKVKNIKPVESFNIDAEIGDKVMVASRYVLYGFLFKKSFTQGFDIKNIVFESTIHEEIRDYILKCIAQNKNINFSDLYEILPVEDEKEISLIASMETDEKRDEQKHFDQEEYFNDCVKAIKLHSIEKQMELLSSRYTAEKDSDARRQIAESISKLLKEKNNLR